MKLTYLLIVKILWLLVVIAFTYLLESNIGNRKALSGGLHSLYKRA